METLLIILVVILGVLVVAQAARVLEVSGSLKKGEDTSDTDVTDKDNNNQGLLMLIFMIFMFGSFIWMVIKYQDIMLPGPASEHGADIDNLWDISMWLIIVVFFITQALLFFFAYRFRGNKKKKAVYMEHDNRLEFIWTIVPAVVLAVLIIYGLTTWTNIMNPSEGEEEPMVVEIYAKQFGWTARYAGEDNTLGYANVRMIEGTNVLGVDGEDKYSKDDVVTALPELHLPVGKPVLFKFRSQDVIHSAYLPHFRVQMNCVPGTATQFRFTPSVTTADMRLQDDVKKKVASVNAVREAKGEDLWEFDYILLCNKICGAAHYNMQMKIVVETEEEYNKWMKEQKTFAEL